VSELLTLPLDQIIPYERNPRVISAEDVEKVRASIQAYGYQAPIMVDRDHVIIAGHTRLQALQALGYPEARVLVVDLPPELVTEYRVVDNRAAELTSWDQGMLIPELREFVNPEHLQLFFPEVDLSLGYAADHSPITDDDLEAAQRVLDNRFRSRPVREHEIECPACERSFVIST